VDGRRLHLARRGGRLRAQGRSALLSCVARWIERGTSGVVRFHAAHGHSATEPPGAGAPCSWPPDTSLPVNVAADASADLQPFDGTLNHAAALVPDYVNLTDAATPLMGTSERKTLMLQFVEELAALPRRAVFEDGALDNVSTLVLPTRGIRFAQLPPGAPAGGFAVGPPDGMRAHSTSVYAAQWEVLGEKLRAVQMRPDIPLPEDSLSAMARMGAAAVALSRPAAGTASRAETPTGPSTRAMSARRKSTWATCAG
jgi:hypothetical protein